MVPAYGVVGYNGYKLPATYQLKLNSTPVYSDENNMTLKYVNNVLTATFILSQELIPNPQPPFTTDNELETIRTVLQQPRRDLYISFQGSGYGANGIFIYPNTDEKEYVPPIGLGNPTNVPYINEIGGGPQPKIINWEPIGTNAACSVTWSVEFRTLRCPFDFITKIEDHDEPLSLEFDRNFSINQEGRVTITTSGSMEVPTLYLTVKNAKTSKMRLLSTADNHRILMEKLLSRALPTYLLNEAPEGFVVKRYDRNLSKSGTRLEFTIVVEELPSDNPLFPYSIKIDAKHKINSSLKGDNFSGTGLFSWTNNFEATITVAPGYRNDFAHNIFFFLFQQRYGRIGPGRIIDPDADQTHLLSDGSKPRVMLISLEIEEDIYTRTHSFRAEYLGVYSLQKLLIHSGLFSPMYARKDDLGKNPWEAGYVPNRTKEWRNHYSTVTDTLFITQRGYRDSEQRFSFIFDTCNSDYRNEFILDPSRVHVNSNPPTPDPADGTTTPPTPPSGSPGDLPRPEGDIFALNEDGSNNVGSGVTDQSDYIAYSNTFEFMERSRVYPIGIQDTSDAINEYKESTNTQLSGNNPYSVSPNELVLYGKSEKVNSPESAISAVAGGSDFIVTIRGYGVRYNKAVPVPGVVGMYNGNAFTKIKRTGTPRTAKKVIGAGDNKLHVTTWVISYHVPFPLTGTIKMDNEGNSERHNELTEGGRFFPA